MTSTTAAKQILAKGSRSFSWASRALPPALRDDAAMLYAFCRRVDDIADEGDDPNEARTTLRQVEDELNGRHDPRPFVASFLELAGRRGIDVRAARHLVVSVRSDLDPVRMSSTAELLRYCYGVAGTVGLMMSRILGVERRESDPHAIDLGIAMQLTNICRDVDEDARRGRVYLPSSLLIPRGVDPEDLVDGRADHEAVQAVIRTLLRLADSYYASAERGMRDIPAVPRLAILIASRVYRAIGVRLLARGTRWWEGRTVVGPFGKLFETVRAFVRYPMLPRPEAHEEELHFALLGLPGASGRGAS